MKRILITLIIIFAIIFVGILYTENIKKNSDYKQVSIKELINDPKKYDGQNILIKGKFTKMIERPLPECIPIGTGDRPEIKEEYKTYPSAWGIYDQDGEIGVMVYDEKLGIISTLPNYREDQGIELKGIARSTTVSDYCDLNIRYRSIYIEVNVRDIDVTLKPLSENLPQDR